VLLALQLDDLEAPLVEAGAACTSAKWAAASCRFAVSWPRSERKPSLRGISIFMKVSKLMGTSLMSGTAETAGGAMLALPEAP
jgi:hypothetical protein